MILYLVRKIWMLRFLEQSLLLKHMEPAGALLRGLLVSASFIIIEYITVARNTSTWTNFISFSGLFILDVYAYPGECAHMAAKTAVNVSKTWFLVMLSVSSSTGSD